jgi:hypothetical protein
MVSRRLTQQVHFAGLSDGFGAIPGIELAIDIVDVGLDRTHGDEEVFGDLRIGPTGS